MSELVVVKDNQAYYVGDWLEGAPAPVHRSPYVIQDIHALSPTERTVTIRSPLFEETTYPIEQFLALLENRTYVLIKKPVFFMGQKLRNRFTEKSVEVIDIPRLRNETGGDYAYYVLTFTPTFGFNHEVMREQELDRFYVSEGVVEV